MKAQSALEYLMVVAITLMVIVPATFLFYGYSKESTEQIIYPRIGDIGRSIIDNAETVYYSGEHSKIVMNLDMPAKVNDIYILYNRELVFEVEGEAGVSELVFFSDVNITSDSCIVERCDLSNIASAGPKKVKLESINKGKEVLINKVE
jgi:hypothetical protein